MLTIDKGACMPFLNYPPITKDGKANLFKKTVLPQIIVKNSLVCSCSLDMDELPLFYISASVK